MDNRPNNTVILQQPNAPVSKIMLQNTDYSGSELSSCAEYSQRMFTPEKPIPIKNSDDTKYSLEKEKTVIYTKVSN